MGSGHDQNCDTGSLENQHERRKHMSLSETCVKDEVGQYWINLADDPGQRVVHDGFLYIVFDHETMQDTGSALHRVVWLDPERTAEHHLIPQGAVPDWIRDRFPDNTLSLQYLDK